MISLLDKYVGCILDTLDELEIADNTIIVFTSDNGATFLGPMAEFFDSVGELRGLKGRTWEGGIRVPAIIRYPGRVEPGSSSDLVSGFEDWLPTLLEMVDGKPDAHQKRQYLYREFAGYGGHQAVWMGRWKGIRVDLQKALNPIELYDLESDPGESKKLASSHPEIVSKIESIMKAEHVYNPKFALRAIDSPDALNKLKTLNKLKK